jgi:phospholipid N-methyltransferase
MRTATLMPSSIHLATRMADALSLPEAKVVVEIGAGTGALTEAVLPRLKPAARFLAVERNPALLEAWRKRFHGWRGVEGNVADLGSICGEEGLAGSGVCCVVSGLPWPAFPDWLQNQALDEIVKVLRPGGQMVTFGYHMGLMMPAGQRFLKRVGGRFQKVERLPWVWRNVPPAYILRCTR